MYGMNVHKAVQDAKEKKSGMTIHYVNEHYDEGNIIAQFEVALDQDDDHEAIAKKVLALEHKHYAPTIEQVVKNFKL